MGEKLTVLETFGPMLTKIYKSDGTTDAYDDAASFRVKHAEVSDLRQVANILSKLHPNPTRCLIRGKFVGADKAAKGNVEGSIVRTNANFDDQPLHWFMVDIDGFEPGFADPVLNPDLAVLEFIEAALPEEFKGASFYWHLSSSAGMPGKEGILKCHVHFWSKTAYTTAQMYEWAKVVGTAVDKAVYRRVQVHYTADPIFEEGRVDPVPQRAGWYQGEHDEVDLQISEELLAQARDQGAGSGGQDMKLVDPSEKDGLIGAFHRAFTPEQVLLEILEGEFEQVTERRYTWLNGGGTPEGVWLHTDGMHVGSSHNTWPIDGIANLWDLVRVFKFGDLDIGKDDFERMDLDHTPVGARPSDLAMKEWASQLPEIKTLIAEEKGAVLNGFLDEIQHEEDPNVIEELIAPRIRAETELSTIDRERLAQAIKARVQVLTNANIAIADARRMVKQARPEMATDTPEWAKKWVWVNATDRFVNIETKEAITQTSYNAAFDRYMGPFADSNGNIPRASEMSLNVWNTPIVSNVEYNPRANLFFSRDGLEMLNTYRPELLPEMPAHFNAAQLEAIRTVEQHFEILIPNTAEREIMLDYLAYCVQNPGRKVRWAPLIIGMEGDGKTAITTMMGLVMGAQNVRTLNNSTLESSFTGWAQGQVFVCIEEVKLHNSNKFDIFNNLKPIITNDFIEVHAKGKDPINLPNLINLLMLTNFDDALPVSSNDRRVFFIKSPFYGSSKEHLAQAIKEKTGLAMADFHDKLFDVALKGHPGALRKWLMDRQISASFKPDSRAPETAMREIAVDLSKTDLEIAIMGVLEEGGPGIYGSLVSTNYLLQAVRDRYGIEPKSTNQIAVIMGRLGWTSYGAPARWRGKVQRWYYRGERPKRPSEEADRLEAEREANEVAGEFAD